MAHLRPQLSKMTQNSSFWQRLRSTANLAAISHREIVPLETLSLAGLHRTKSLSSVGFSSSQRGTQRKHDLRAPNFEQRRRMRNERLCKKERCRREVEGKRQRDSNTASTRSLARTGTMACSSCSPHVICLGQKKGNCQVIYQVNQVNSLLTTTSCFTLVLLRDNLHQLLTS